MRSFQSVLSSTATSSPPHYLLVTVTSVSSAVLQWQLLADLYHRQLLARANPFWDMLTNVFCGTSELQTWWAHTNFRDFWCSLTKNFRDRYLQVDYCQHHNAAIKNPAPRFSSP